MPLDWTRPTLVLMLIVAPIAGAPPVVMKEAELARRIDERLAARWKAKNAVPAPAADEATFIRRAYLDLAGRIPSILEVRDFLDDERPDRRRIWIETLVKGIRKDRGSDTFSDHLGSVWGDWLVPYADGENGPRHSTTFQTWMRGRIKENVGYDRIVRRILLNDTSSGTEVSAFHQANENMPVNLASSTARLFLGIKLECAQCHDDRSGGQWTREQFWELAAFFDPNARPLIPNTKRTVEARFLDGTKPTKNRQPELRASLVDWIVSADNPRFARAAVNRVWAHLFGVGLIDPIDEFGEHNPPSHPELLDDLAAQFAAHGYDIKYLVRSLVLTEAYRRSSRTTHPSQDDPRLFARMPVRGLSAAQLFDSLAEATEYRHDRNIPLIPSDRNRRESPRDEFLARFHNRERAVESGTTILQALHLMNGPFMIRATTLEHNRTLATVAEASSIDTDRRLETLFLVALSRLPTEAETKRLRVYVDRGGPTGSLKKALADVFWAMLNSAEFRVNH